MKHKKYKLLVLESLALSSILFTNSLTINHRSIVSYNTYNEGNTTNLVLNKILSDNELKQEIPHMFNYASNGNYYDISNHKYQNNKDYITEGLYSREDEDGTTYYYRGDIDNNNLIFGAYDEDYYIYYVEGNVDQYFQSLESCQEATNRSCTPVKLASAGDKMYWKIVRINGDSSIRLIYNGPGLNDLKLGAVEVSFNEEEISGVVGAVPYNLNFNYPKYTGYTYDNGTDSFIKKEVDTWYNNTLGKNNAYDQYVILGRFCSDSSKFLEQESNILFSSFDRLRQVDYNFAKDNAPTFICPETTESYGGSYKLKAGLITADELVFAGESVGIGNSYLNTGEHGEPYWTMTPDNFFYNGAYVLLEYAGLNSSYINRYYTVRPVINIKTEGMTLTGDGTSDNPYYLEEAKTNNYEGVITIEEGSSSDIPPAFQEDVPLDIDITWTSDDESISKIEDNKILGLKEGQTIIRGVSSDGLSNYLIKVTVIKNPVTMSNIYLVMGITLILGLATITYGVYRRKSENV